MRNSCCWRTTETRGQGDLEDTSQRTEDWQKRRETTEREGLDNMDRTEEQEDWSAGKAEKSKPVAERARLTVER